MYLSHRAMKFYSPNRIFSLLDHLVGIVGCHGRKSNDIQSNSDLNIYTQKKIKL